ncbi:DUF4279 domain-containing protein [Streptomyces sp. NBC_01363]|uniref:DUF4279 domain-containing protein n=1 Tax=Streptomyces sp. NBC_01363 TaxID=2903840 RepID=UPI002250AB6B|nr:DUF4279 domain-containing protein [Streptomyces sp. NBC_01363]MCX4734546.1 DUF4279 domain-containing protein [Streptomyces sp. NBC_01363]
MPLNQYVYFALSSERTTAREMADLLGIEPDEVTVRASRLAEPPRPVCHRWKIVCRAPGLRVDEQVTQILDRLRPHTGRIAELVRRLDPEGECPSAVLEIVRYFNDDECADEADRPDTSQHPNLFGWHLDRDVLDFLSATGAVLDVDEYDLTPDAPEDQSAIG